MKTIPMNLTIDRHITNGSATMKGTVNGERVQVQVERGVEDANAYVNGQVGADSVLLTFHRTAENGYVSVIGSYGKTRFDGEFRRHQPDGDTTVSQGGAQLFVDRQNQGQRVALQSSAVHGGFERQLRDGDLSLSGTVPEGMKLFPLLWEVLGDDKNIRDRNPEYPGSVMAMSLFFQNQGS